MIVAKSLSEVWPVGSVARSKRWVTTLVVLPLSPLPGASASGGVKDVLTNRISACMRRFNVAEVDEECSPSLQHELNNRGEKRTEGTFKYSPWMIQKCRPSAFGCQMLRSKP